MVGKSGLVSTLYFSAIRPRRDASKKLVLTIVFFTSSKKFLLELLSQNELLEELRQEKYDVGLISTYDSCGVGLLYLIGIQSVNCFSATPMTDILSWQLGIPMPPSYLTGKHSA